MSMQSSRKRISYASSVKRIFDLTDPDARLVLRRLIKECNVFTSTFDQANPYQTAFNEGQRHVVCSLLACLKMDTELALSKIAELERENETEP